MTAEQIRRVRVMCPGRPSGPVMRDRKSISPGPHCVLQLERVRVLGDQQPTGKRRGVVIGVLGGTGWVMAAVRMT
ncbi:hypothetical protein [Nocardia niwae]|uniref:hypothetical protein n=1 Tax=Nocardia niwae TaxID=626084 RepID=UPI0007A3E166|nr:hypothetical protein [Nocardia niwae]